ncbi:MAG: YvcK family protein [Candidatus Sulfobium sp.]
MLDASTIRRLERSAESQLPMRITEEARPGRPEIVALGGGTGLPVVLRSLKNRLYSDVVHDAGPYKRSGKRLTAIVTVTDDGGSSGRLRRDLNILPPGDIRNCLSALSDNSALSNDLFQYRFERGSGLTGHNMGNLLLAALTDLKGDFVQAVECCSEMMNVRGQILPSTRTNVSLFAKFTDGTIVKGESAIVKHRGRLERIFLYPKYTETHPSAISAIEKADAIVLGPGSLFTSVIPNLLVKDIFSAIRRSRAKKIYVCNLMTEPGETAGYAASDHVRAIFDHAGQGFFRYVILNNGRVPGALHEKYAREGFHPVRIDKEKISALGLTAVVADVISGEQGKIRHDEDKLGRVLLDLICPP